MKLFLYHISRGLSDPVTNYIVSPREIDWRFNADQAWRARHAQIQGEITTLTTAAAFASFTFQSRRVVVARVAIP